MFPGHSRRRIARTLSAAYAGGLLSEETFDHRIDEVLQDLASMNGSFVNGARVGRCQLRPGDRLRIGDQELLID